MLFIIIITKIKKQIKMDKFNELKELIAGLEEDVVKFYGANYVIAKGVMPTYVGPNGFILMRVMGAVVLFWIILLLFSK